ncbi:MAG: hypothetical protein M0R80_20910 [Proteobacteria bacterium]|nr:hypothetical protein [Pseudomonadota bacterium]
MQMFEVIHRPHFSATSSATANAARSSPTPSASRPASEMARPPALTRLTMMRRNPRAFSSRSVRSRLSAFRRVSTTMGTAIPPSARTADRDAAAFAWLPGTPVSESCAAGSTEWNGKTNVSTPSATSRAYSSSPPPLPLLVTSTPLPRSRQKRT